MFLVFAAAAAAQEKPCSDASDLRAWKQTVLMNYKSAKAEEKKLAADAAKKYVDKTGKCGMKDEFADWIKSHASTWTTGANAAAAPSVDQTYDAELAKKLGADERGMKMYVMCILKTGPNDANIKGKEREDIFAGHFANIQNLAGQGKLAIAGPFETNPRNYRGLYIFNVPTLEEAEKLVVLDPAVKAGIFVPEMTLLYASASLMAINEIHKKIQKPQPKTN
jgi:uncharacterized protein YciI